jgi:hypothetical protein
LAKGCSIIGINIFNFLEFLFYSRFTGLLLKKVNAVMLFFFTCRSLLMGGFFGRSLVEQNRSYADVILRDLSHHIVEIMQFQLIVYLFSLSKDVVLLFKCLFYLIN